MVSVWAVKLDALLVLRLARALDGEMAVLKAADLAQAWGRAMAAMLAGAWDYRWALELVVG